MHSRNSWNFRQQDACARVTIGEQRGTEDSLRRSNHMFFFSSTGEGRAPRVPLEERCWGKLLAVASVSARRHLEQLHQVGIVSVQTKVGFSATVQFQSCRGDVLAPSWRRRWVVQLQRCRARFRTSAAVRQNLSFSSLNWKTASKGSVRLNRSGLELSLAAIRRHAWLPLLPLNLCALRERIDNFTPASCLFPESSLWRNCRTLVFLSKSSFIGKPFM